MGYFEPPRGDYTLAPYPPSTHAEARRWRQLAIAEPTVKSKRKRK